MLSADQRKWDAPLIRVGTGTAVWPLCLRPPCARPRFRGSRVVQDDDISWTEHRSRSLLDIALECLAVGRVSNGAGGGDPVVAQASDQGRGFPVAEGGRPVSLRPLSPSPGRGYVGLDPGLVEEDRPVCAHPDPVAPPILPAVLHVLAAARLRDRRLFLKTVAPKPKFD